MFSASRKFKKRNYIKNIKYQNIDGCTNEYEYETLKKKKREIIKIKIIKYHLRYTEKKKD
jgi:hypothetical protein